jgi:sugar/nucleoside kinase (ribokinase family)
MHNFDLIGVGNPIVDIVARVDEAFVTGIAGDKCGMVLVASGSLDALLARLPDGMERHPGGSAGNTAFAAARLGLRTTFLGKTGADAWGRFYRASFAALGGDTARFRTGALPTGRCLALVTPDSERTLRTDLGAAVSLRPDEFSAADFAGCRHAHVEGYLLFNRDLFRAVLAAARAAGCSVSLDLAAHEVVRASRDFLPDLLRSSVDMVFANEDEAAAWFAGAGDPPQQARQLADICGLAAVKVGAAGAWIADRTQCVHVPAVPGITAIDSTGAGDHWAAGFLHGHLHGKPLAEAGRRGALLGAAIVQHIGPKIPEALWPELLQAIGGR